MKLSAYPMYNSLYETFYLVDKIMDIGFKRHKALGQIWIEMARDLADSLILPFNVTDYSNALQDLSDTLLAQFGKLMDDYDVNTDFLKQGIHNFTEAVHDFEKNILNANKNDPFVVRRINDQLMELDRAFLDHNGLPGRKYKRHMIFTESSINTYDRSRFPGLADALTLITQKKDVTAQWEIVQKHNSVILFAIQGAASTLKDVSNFMYDY